MKKKYKRKKILIRPRLQLLYALVFTSTAALYVFLQTILFHWTLDRIAARVPTGSEAVLSQVMVAMRTNLLITFLILVPLTLWLGVYVTFRVAGPLYRFEQFLKSVNNGERPGPCRIRKTDELHDICALLNEVTAPLREPAETIRLDSAEDVPSPTPSAEPAEASSQAANS